ncbi:hypothetical protein RR21198_3552 [Rhodococcus rhodochrous ATCC 21198]|nr:hypothetical protein RR21198_3552 [Rhodococcus rhodochrous ATCC 21198]
MAFMQKALLTRAGFGTCASLAVPEALIAVQEIARPR